MQCMVSQKQYRKDNNLCVIGDPNQAIYKFRGADVQFINNFKQDFKDAAVINLKQSSNSCAVLAMV